jgi:hypothetical protein
MTTTNALDGVILPISQGGTNQSVSANLLANVTNLVPGKVFFKYRAARTKTLQNLSDTNILCIGDSTTAGTGDSTTASSQSIRAYPAGLATIMNTGSCPTMPSLAIPPRSDLVDTRWVAGSGWTLGGQPFGLGAAVGNTAGVYFGTSTAGNLVYTPNPQVTCDGFYIIYCGGGATGTITATATGGTPVVINTVGAGGVYKSALISAAAANTTNTLTMTSTVNNCFIVGVEAVLSTKKQLLIHNGGFNSLTANGIVNGGTANFNAIPTIKAIAPDLTIISLGINDAIAGTSASSFSTSMQSIITAAQLSGDVLLCDMLPSGAGGAGGSAIATEQSYLPVYTSLALANNCAYASINGRWNATYTTTYMNGDQVHGNDVGYWDWAQFIANIITNP